MLYPNPSNPRTWEKSKFMLKDKGSVLPYYLGNNIGQTDIARLFEHIMSGIDNDEEWKDLLGVDILRKSRTYYTIQVDIFIEFYGSQIIFFA